MGAGCRYEHPVKGQGIYAYVTLHEGSEYQDSLRKELVQTVRDQIGAFAAPDVIHWAPGRLAIGLRVQACHRVSSKPKVCRVQGVGHLLQHPPQHLDPGQLLDSKSRKAATGSHARPAPPGGEVMQGSVAAILACWPLPSRAPCPLPEE